MKGNKQAQIDFFSNLEFNIEVNGVELFSGMFVSRIILKLIIGLIQSTVNPFPEGVCNPDDKYRR